MLFRDLVQNSVPVSGETAVIVRRSDDGEPEVVGSSAKPEFLSLTFAPWGEWRTMQVIDEHGGLDLDGLAAALYYVMTFHGWPEDRIARIDQLTDMFEKLVREWA